MDPQHTTARRTVDVATLLERVADPAAPIELLYAVLERALDPTMPLELLYSVLERARHIEQATPETPGRETRAAPTAATPPPEAGARWASPTGSLTLQLRPAPGWPPSRTSESSP